MNVYQKLHSEKKAAEKLIRAEERKLIVRVEKILQGLGVRYVHVVSVLLKENTSQSTYLICKVHRVPDDWIIFASWINLMLLVLNFDKPDNHSVQVAYLRNEQSISFELNIGELEDAENRARASNING